eukprot:COSAG02_NODE_5358_length_4399_cov_16.010930_1_plen_174_part_00
MDHVTDTIWINRIQFPSHRGGTRDSGYVKQDTDLSDRLATQILQAYRMVRKINPDRFYKMHGTPGGTVRDTELKIHVRDRRGTISRSSTIPRGPPRGVRGRARLGAARRQPVAASPPRVEFGNCTDLGWHVGDHWQRGPHPDQPIYCIYLCRARRKPRCAASSRLSSSALRWA